MSFPNVRRQMVIASRQILASNAANAVTLLLQWTEYTGPADLDFNDESALADAESEQKEQEFRALVHEVDHRLTGYQKFMEVSTGDLIVDFLDDLQLDGKKEVVIRYNGVAYVQKTASNGLKEAWDVGGAASNPGVFRTLLLTPNQ